MSDWSLAIAVLAALIGLATLGHRIFVQIIGRIDAMSQALSNEMAKRFDESERRRVEGSEVWQERLGMRDQHIQGLRRDLDDHRRYVEEQFVRRETWIESEGRTLLRLEQIRELLSKLDTHHG